jgi:hypothetical protein
MTFNRRNFVQGATCLAAAPAIVNFLLLAPSAQSNESITAELSPEPDAAVQAAANNPLFKIHGWDCLPNIGVDQSSSTACVNDDRAVIRLTQAWRTAWR